MLRASELASSGSMQFILGMYEDSSIFTAEIYGWTNLLGQLVVWESPIIGAQVNLLQDYYEIVINDDIFGFWMGSELGPRLWALIYYENWPPVGLKLIFDIPPGSKAIYLKLEGSPSWATLAVPPSGSCPKFLPPTSGTCLTSTSHAMTSATVSGAWPTLPWQCGFSWNFNKAKDYKKVEIKLEVSVVLVVFFVSTL